MKPYYQDDAVTLYHGDCRTVLPTLGDASVESVVTDPPYELAFMGRRWDASGVAFDPAVWSECLRVLKPGGHMLAFGGSRTWHRLACAVEDAGFEIRDSIAWLYGSGFPKSLDVSKAIDRAAGAEREVVGLSRRHGGGVAGAGSSYEVSPVVPVLTAPATPDAERWLGWGTALKPAFEPVVVARKPLAGTVAANVLAHGAGALNIDACRVATGETLGRTNGIRNPGDASSFLIGDGSGRFDRSDSAGGRWPTNVALDQHTAAEIDQQSGETTSTLRGKDYDTDKAWFGGGRASPANTHADSGGASRFFPVFRYEAKAPTSERPRAGDVAHPTVKPLDLMRWLVRLVTPPGGLVLDPFAGSGTTAEACVIEGFRCVTIEREADYLPLITARLTKPLEPVLDLGALA